MATATRTSSIAVALAAQTASVDIPKPRDGSFPASRDNFTAVATKPAANHQHGMLPTPPNSISPNLPPRNFKNRAAVPHSPPFSSPHLDSDIDLHDVDHADNREKPEHHALNAEALDSLGDLDSSGAITPGLLSKHHLPDILLAHGPLAIRHVMGYLTTSVPGFSRIPPAKARRLVVGALEGRGSGGDGGGLDGNVIFEKVGWGRWDARLRGQPSRERQAANMHSPPASLTSSYSPNGREIPGKSHRTARPRGDDSATFSHSEIGFEDHDIDMLEHEADKMSLDGNDDNAYCSSSEAPDDLYLDGDLGEGDVTDEEDWAGIGAAALRAKSFSTATSGSRLYQPIAFHSKSFNRSNRSVSKPAQAVAAKSLPRSAAGPVHMADFSFPDGVSGDSQEREAVEALLKLGSM